METAKRITEMVLKKQELEQHVKELSLLGIGTIYSIHLRAITRDGAVRDTVLKSEFLKLPELSLSKAIEQYHEAVYKEIRTITEELNWYVPQKKD